MEVVSVLDSTLFEDFIKLKTQKVREIIQTGVNGGTVDWTESTRPHGQSVHCLRYSFS